MSVGFLSNNSLRLLIFPREVGSQRLAAMEVFLNPQPRRIAPELGELNSTGSTPMASQSKISQCHCPESSVKLESKDSLPSPNLKLWQSSSKTGLSNVFSEKIRLDSNGGHGRVRIASVSRRFNSTGFSSYRKSQTGFKGNRFADNCEKSWRPKVAGLSIQSAVGGSRLFGDKPRIWHWREQAFRARCTAFGHAEADDGDSFVEEQGGASDVTESLPPAQPSIASWVFRLWKVMFILLRVLLLHFGLNGLNVFVPP